MDLPFEHCKCVTGQGFLAREADLRTMRGLIRSGRNVVMYDPVDSGKESLVGKTMIALRSESFSYTLVTVDLYNVRSSNAFCIKYNNALCASFPDMQSPAVQRAARGEQQLGKDAVARILALPEKICVEKGRRLVVLFKNFHNTLLFSDSDEFLKKLEQEWTWHANTSYIVTGNGVNAMKTIFEQKKYFYGQFETLHLSRIEKRIFTEYINSMFLKVGKVIDRSQLDTIYDIAGGHPGYVNRLSSICYDKTFGYITPVIMKDAINSMMSAYIPVYESIMYDLTENQIWLLRAVYDGVQKFSSAGILEKYHLNSSANVYRLKEALCKKEVISFDENDNAYIIDPLFRYWLKEFYFVDL